MTARARYQFFPWVARGVGAGLGEPDTGDTLPDRLRVDVGVEVNGAVVATTKVQVHGPGDVLGIDPRQIVRTEPTAGTTDFEPNYFAHLELGEAALPWLFTPAAPDLAADQLRPWCVLVVVAVQDGVTVGPGKVLPVLEISRPAIPGRELPDLAESWAWVHAQAVAAEGTTPQQALAGDERLSLARLLCPRRLDPLTSYHACLVPAFDAGVAAGLGEPVSTETSIAPAWRSGDDAPAELRLPVYHHWQFATGPVGDFESLVQRLQPRPVPATVGRRAMYLGAAGSGLPELRSRRARRGRRPGRCSAPGRAGAPADPRPGRRGRRRGTPTRRRFRSRPTGRRCAARHAARRPAVRALAGPAPHHRRRHRVAPVAAQLERRPA